MVGLLKFLWRQLGRLLRTAWGVKKPKRRRRQLEHFPPGPREQYLYLYAIPGRSLVKIGYSTQPDQREAQIRRSVAEVYRGDPGAMIAVWPGTMRDEAKLHKYYSAYSAHMPNGIEGYTEWFRLRGPVQAWAKSMQQMHPSPRPRLRP